MIWKNTTLELPKFSQNVLLFNLSNYNIAHYNSLEKSFTILNSTKNIFLEPIKTLFWMELSPPLIPDFKTNIHTIIQKIEHFFEIGGTHYIECIANHIYLIIRISDKSMNLYDDTIKSNNYLSFISKPAIKKNVHEYYRESLKNWLIIRRVQHEIISNNPLKQYLIIRSSHNKSNIIETGWLTKKEAELKMLSAVYDFDIQNLYPSDNGFFLYDEFDFLVYSLGDKEYSKFTIIEFNETISLHFVDELDENGQVYNLLLN